MAEWKCATCGCSARWGQKDEHLRGRRHLRNLELLREEQRAAERSAARAAWRELQREHREREEMRCEDVLSARAGREREERAREREREHREREHLEREEMGREDERDCAVRKGEAGAASGGGDAAMRDTRESSCWVQ